MPANSANPATALPKNSGLIRVGGGHLEVEWTACHCHGDGHKDHVKVTDLSGSNSDVTGILRGMSYLDKTHTCRHTCICKHMCACILTHTHTHTHTCPHPIPQFPPPPYPPPQKQGTDTQNKNKNKMKQPKHPKPHPTNIQRRKNTSKHDLS